ncbi:hydrolase [Pseudoalteromonas piscicida]|uniref:beta-lactamase n=1 Tax=Pseudoalteromonas piscicida TaxID=43662 RepID=A0A2A5JUK4_PSEO7|nr:MBL fold metallo-hydrolase [Pseudoalteromonas piscicida]PCK33090.1 hydrolase [Pseudoalteromonas piscicida]
MKTTITYTLIAAALSVVNSTCALADEVELKLQEVSQGLHVLFGQGGNIAVSSGSDGIYIVDDQFAKLSEQIKAKIKTIKPHAPEFVINTHHHGDHTGGNENFAQAGSHVIAHHNVYKRLEHKHGDGSDYLPTLTFGSDMKLHFNDEHAHLWHYHHAHTDGDAVVFFQKANVVHMGDIYFNLGSLPFVDVDSGGTLNGVITAVKDVLAKTDHKTKIIPGHGPVTDKSGLQAYLALLQKAKNIMLEAMKNNASLEQVVSARPLQPLNLTYAKWLPEERVTTLFYRSLKSN